MTHAKKWSFILGVPVAFMLLFSACADLFEEKEANMELRSITISPTSGPTDTVVTITATVKNNKKNTQFVQAVFEGMPNLANLTDISGNGTQWEGTMTILNPTAGNHQLTQVFLLSGNDINCVSCALTLYFENGRNKYDFSNISIDANGNENAEKKPGESKVPIPVFTYP